jgi:hypothetical protein
VSDLDTLFAGKKRRGQGCRWHGCGAPTRALVLVQIRRFAEGEHTSGRYDASASTQISLCELHAVEAWSAVREAMGL